MIKYFIVLFLFLLASNIQSQMTSKERDNLLNKYAKKIGKNFNTIFNRPKSFYHGNYFTYEPSKIKEIINKYKFPENYNFIEETNATVHIKDQAYCGACWAFSSTTALSYRYHKIGIEVNLSPQYLISCYLKDCLLGEYIINTQFALVTYGTVTEECLPYSSNDGETIEDCPSECKNKEELKIYYAKNAYSTQIDYYNGDYYDIVTIILDQLINYGPVIADIDVYEDFDALYNSDNCSEIYKYDGYSNYTGGHAVVIVGYGYEDSKYYWIIQNSWGTNFCGDGFAKIEFGEIGIEKVSFSEPYIPENNSTEKTINAHFTLTKECNFKFNTEIDEIQEPFELYFQNVENSSSEFYYQCSLSPLVNSKNEGICNFNFYNTYEPKGYYKYKNYESINNKNIYNLDFSSLTENQFYFYGVDYIDYFYEYNYYISEEGSGIILYYSIYENDLSLLPKIYPNINIEQALSNCTIISEAFDENDYYIYCRIKKEEINYFDSNKNLPMTYDILCGTKEPMNAFVYKLDKTKYPVFKVKYFIMPEGDECKFIIVSNIEGSISEFTEGNEFYSLININSKDTTEIYNLFCEIPLPSKIQDNYEISCEIYLENNTESDSFCLNFENNTDSYNFYLTPYYMIFNSTCPFEIFIENNIKAIKYDDYKKIQEKTFTQILLSLISNRLFILSLIFILILLILLKLV